MSGTTILLFLMQYVRAHQQQNLGIFKVGLEVVKQGKAKRERLPISADMLVDIYLILNLVL